MKKILLVMGLLGAGSYELICMDHQEHAQLNNLEAGESLVSFKDRTWQWPQFYATKNSVRQTFSQGCTQKAIQRLNDGDVSIFMMQTKEKDENLYFVVSDLVVRNIPQLQKQFRDTHQDFQFGDRQKSIGSWEIPLDFEALKLLFPSTHPNGDVDQSSTSFPGYINTLLFLQAQVQDADKSSAQKDCDRFIDEMNKHQREHIFAITFSDGTRLEHVLRPTWMSWFKHHKGKIGGGLAVTFMGLLVWLANYHNK